MSNVWRAVGSKTSFPFSWTNFWPEAVKHPQTLRILAPIDLLLLKSALQSASKVLQKNEKIEAANNF